MEQFSYVKRGYSPEEVNKYIATLEQVIKSYKDKDNAIKNAIISAQVAADNVVRNAHLQAQDYKKKISQQLLQVSASIDAERMRLQAFHDVYMGLMKKYLFEIASADMHEMSRRLDDMEVLINDLLAMEIPPINDATPLLPDPESTLTPFTAQPYTPEPAEDKPIPPPAAEAVEPEPFYEETYEEALPRNDEEADGETTFTQQEMETEEFDEPPVAPPPRYT